MRLVASLARTGPTLPVLLAIAGLAAPPALAQQHSFDTSHGPVAVEVVAGGLQNPWSLAFLPDGRLLVTERSGNLRIVENGETGAPIAGVPEVVARGQGGLLDVALAPDFAQSGRLYLSFSEPGPGGAGTAVLAATLVTEGDSGRLEDARVIFRMNRFTGAGQHFGSRIVIGRDNNLFVTLGERGDRDRAQDFADLAGAVVRIAPDGSVPPDNPRPEGWAPELWSKGHRNPQGAALNPEDGRLWVVEHGAQGGDEINLPEAGGNYGWPVITYGIDYSGAPIGEGTEKPGYEQPLYYWDPSIAPSGMAFVEGDLFPEWSGDVLVGALKFQLLVRLDREDGAMVGEERLFEGAFGRIRDVRMGPDGAIYLVTDENPGQVLRVSR